MPVQDDRIGPGCQADVGIQENGPVAVSFSCCVMLQEEGIVLLRHRFVHLVKDQPADDILAFSPQFQESFRDP